MTEDEMVGWHYRLNVHELEQTLGDSGGQVSLVCRSPWSCKEWDVTERLNNVKTVFSALLVHLVPSSDTDTFTTPILQTRKQNSYITVLLKITCNKGWTEDSSVTLECRLLMFHHTAVHSTASVKEKTGTAIRQYHVATEMISG